MKNGNAEPTSSEGYQARSNNGLNFPCAQRARLCTCARAQKRDCSGNTTRSSGCPRNAHGSSTDNRSGTARSTS